MNSVQNILSQFSAKWLLFTDLDGTLLDRHYNLQAAGKALDHLHQYGCVCIPASSKTQLEMAELNKRRKFPSPYIFENGSGLQWPSASHPELFGRSALEIGGLLDHIRDEHNIHYRLFRDIPDDELSEITGLDELGVKAAKVRSASMPLIWEDNAGALDTFQGILGFIGLQVVRGGQFQTVLDRSCSKAGAMQRISQDFTKSYYLPRIIACGDAENDLEMLSAADVAVLFPNGDGGYLPLDHPQLHHADNCGETAWLETLERVLSQYEFADRHNQPSEHQTVE